MDINKFEEAMAAFSFKQHQETLTYLAHLESTGWTIEDVKLWVETKKEQVAKVSENWLRVSLNCPECERPMQLLRVNDSEATQTGDPTDQSVWLCQGCGESIYNKESIIEILDRGGN